MTIARLDGEVIAESFDTVILDGKHYFPPRSVRSHYFRPVRTAGEAHYYSVTVAGKPRECACCDAATPDPRLVGYISFELPVVIEEEA
jgi:uncharacterized protein (DUF427 family)